MKQAALMRRKQWDVLFVLAVSDMAEVEDLVQRGVIAGDLQQVWSQWDDNEIWYERNWMQFKEAHRNVVFVSAQDWPWLGNAARFTTIYHHAERCTGSGPDKNLNRKAVALAGRMAKKYKDKKVFVYCRPGADSPWPEIAKFAAGFDGVVAVTSVKQRGGGMQVPWLWVSSEEEDLPFSDDPEAIDEQAALAEAGVDEYAVTLAEIEAAVIDETVEVVGGEQEDKE